MLNTVSVTHYQGFEIEYLNQVCYICQSKKVGTVYVGKFAHQGEAIAKAKQMIESGEVSKQFDDFLF